MHTAAWNKDLNFKTSNARTASISWAVSKSFLCIVRSQISNMASGDQGPTSTRDEKLAGAGGMHKGPPDGPTRWQRTVIRHPEGHQFHISISDRSLLRTQRWSIKDSYLRTYRAQHNPRGLNHCVDTFPDWLQKPFTCILSRAQRGWLILDLKLKMTDCWRQGGVIWTR